MASDLHETMKTFVENIVEEYNYIDNDDAEIYVDNQINTLSDYINNELAETKQKYEHATNAYTEVTALAHANNKILEKHKGIKWYEAVLIAILTSGFFMILNYCIL